MISAPTLERPLENPWQDWTWNRVYGLSIILFMASIPLSKAAGSLAEGLMALCWLAGLWKREEREVRRQRWIQRSWLWGFPLLFLYYVIGGIYSEDVHGWILEINAKHYWFTIPLMWGTLLPKTKTIQHAWWAFVIANLLVAIMVIWIHWTGQPLWEGTSKIPSPLVQRPRASLFLSMAVLWLVHAYRVTPKYQTIPLMVFCFSGLIWMEGRIGQVALVVGLGWMAWQQRRNIRQRLAIITGLGLLVLAAWLVSSSIRKPFLEAIQEIREYQMGYPNSEPEFSSIGMRFTYWSTYMEIFGQNPWLGIGSGDLDQVARPYFQNHPHKIPFNRPHNQWLELGVHQGFPAILIAIFAWMLWWTKRQNEYQHLWEALALIWFLSTWLDCTWSTQAGLSAFMALNLSLLSNEGDPKKPALSP